MTKNGGKHGPRDRDRDEGERDNDDDDGDDVDDDDDVGWADSTLLSGRTGTETWDGAVDGGRQ